jgi:hypothetical protein
MFVGASLWLGAATPEQVERYLMLSGSEDQLIEFEQSIDQMNQMLAAKTGNDVPLMQDSQLLSIRFREYLQQHLSESEMDEIIANYGHDVMRKLVSAEVLMEEPQTLQAYREFLIAIRKEPLPKDRTEAVRAIVNNLYDDDVLIDFFNKLFVPMMRQMAKASGQEITKEQMKEVTEGFIKKMRDQQYNAMLFMTRDFSEEELRELEEIAANSATDHEVKAVFGAIESAMSEAMHNMSKQFADMLAARPKTRSTRDDNQTKTMPASRAPQTAQTRSTN